MRTLTRWPHAHATLDDAGYWGDYDDMAFDPSSGTFMRAFSDSSQGCSNRSVFNSGALHVSSVEIPTFGAIDLVIGTGNDNLRQDSSATADLFLSDNSTLFQTVTLKAEGDAEWANNTLHLITATLKLPTDSSRENCH